MCGLECGGGWGLCLNHRVHTKFRGQPWESLLGSQESYWSLQALWQERWPAERSHQPGFGFYLCLLWGGMSSLCVPLTCGYILDVCKAIQTIPRKPYPCNNERCVGCESGASLRADAEPWQTVVIDMMTAWDHKSKLPMLTKAFAELCWSGQQ